MVGMEACCSRADVKVWSAGVLEARFRRPDVDVWSSEGAVQVCRHEVCRYGALEARCRCSDVEGWTSGRLEVRCT